jgi:hypothetical protein
MVVVVVIVMPIVRPPVGAMAGWEGTEGMPQPSPEGREAVNLPR